MKTIAYAVVGRPQKIVGKGKKEREVLGKQQIIYSGEVLNEGCCDCSYCSDVFLIFKTKKEALNYVEFPPHPYLRHNVLVKRITINY